MISGIQDLGSKKLTSAFCADLSARGADDVGISHSEYRRTHQPIEVTCVKDTKYHKCICQFGGNKMTAMRTLL